MSQYPSLISHIPPTVYGQKFGKFSVSLGEIKFLINNQTDYVLKNLQSRVDFKFSFWIHSFGIILLKYFN